MVLLNDEEYQNTKGLVEDGQKLIAAQRAAFISTGATSEQAEHALGALKLYYGNMESDLQIYEQRVRGEISAPTQLNEIGSHLVALRIASRLSQQELARRLNVSEADVAADEACEYRNATAEAVQRVGRALGLRIEIRVEVTDSYETLAIAA